jgi:putative DNA primase/helicase
MSNQSHTVPTESDVLSQVSEFIGRYLHCSDDQRTVMALWVLHTYCLSAAQVTPYLSIQSLHKQSGKTLCLQLLNLLCDHPALTAGFTASTLARRMKEGIVSAVLLDECQATVGTRARSKSPALRALLASGYHCGPGYTTGPEERDVFRPKAFAGMGQLPEALADRSICIILQPLGPRADLRSARDQRDQIGPQPPGSPSRDGFSRDGVEPPSAALPQATSAAHQRIQRFHLRRATQEAEPLRQQLHAWAQQNLPDLEKRQPYSTQDFPPGLSPRRQDLIEPLLQLADSIGGKWPAQIREALAAGFEEEVVFDLQPSLQLLDDIYRYLSCHGFPERFSTAHLLDWMQAMPHRPWDVDGPLTASKVARLLAPFDIHPRPQRIGATNPARGYQLWQFLEPWQRHFGYKLSNAHVPALSSPGLNYHGNGPEACHQEAPRSGESKACPRDDPRSGESKGQPAAMNEHLTGKLTVTPQQESEIACTAPLR